MWIKLIIRCAILPVVMAILGLINYGQDDISVVIFIGRDYRVKGLLFTTS